MPFPPGQALYAMGDHTETVEFDKCGCVTVTINGELFAETHYRVEHDELIYLDPGADGELRSTGRYKWRLEGDRLYFELLEESLAGRRQAHLAPWTLIG